MSVSTEMSDHVFGKLNVQKCVMIILMCYLFSWVFLLHSLAESHAIWFSSDHNLLALLLLLMGLLIMVSFLAVSIRSEKLLTFFFLLQILTFGASISYIITKIVTSTVWISSVLYTVQLVIIIVAFLFSFLVSIRFRSTLRAEGGRGISMKVLLGKVFGTPPTQFNSPNHRMEISRVSVLSNGTADDIFDDYDDQVKLE